MRNQPWPYPAGSALFSRHSSEKERRNFRPGVLQAQEEKGAVESVRRGLAVGPWSGRGRSPSGADLGGREKGRPGNTFAHVGTKRKGAGVMAMVLMMGPRPALRRRVPECGYVAYACT